MPNYKRITYNEAIVLVEAGCKVLVTEETCHFLEKGVGPGKLKPFPVYHSVTTYYQVEVE